MPPSVQQRLRTLCLSLPDVHEVPSHSEPTFRVANKQFAVFASKDSHHGAGRNAVWVKAAPGMQQLMIEHRPDRFFSPPYVGSRGWVGVLLDRDTNWPELRDILLAGHRLVARKR